MEREILTIFRDKEIVMKFNTVIVLKHINRFMHAFIQAVADVYWHQGGSRTTEFGKCVCEDLPRTFRMFGMGLF